MSKLVSCAGWATLAGLMALQPACGGGSGKMMGPVAMGGSPGSGGATSGAGGRGGNVAGQGGQGGQATQPGADAGAMIEGGTLDPGLPMPGVDGGTPGAPDTNPGPPPGGQPDVGTGNDVAAPIVDAAAPTPDAPPAVTSPWTELTAAGINFQGGKGTQGQAGGNVHLLSQGEILIDPAGAATPAPTIPAVPAGTMVVAAIAADVTGPSLQVGDVVASGTEAVRTISASSGDLFVTGTLRASDLGASRQAIVLSAPAGTVYISGTVDTSGADGAGQAAGAITINAVRVVVTGRLDAAGGDGLSKAAGAGGAITIAADEGIVITGGATSAGGNGTEGNGGKAGNITLQSDGDVGFAGRWLLRGGAATSAANGVQGGGAGILAIEAEGAVRIGGIVDARGGLAAVGAPAAAATGGASGALRVGNAANRIPMTITVVSPLNAAGGEGQTVGGKGGSFRAEPATGNVIVRGARAIDLTGGNATATAGAGGTVFISATEEASSGGVDIQGEIFVDGGSVVAGAAHTGPGGAAGRIEMPLVPLRGTISVGSTGKLSAVGGRSAGTGVAGGGGHVTLYTNDGNLTLAGSIVATGGAAADTGGTGGLGGRVVLWGDQNGNANRVASGNVLIAATGFIEASGGAGTTGGHARNDGMVGSVAGFPEMGAQIAVLIDCDNVTGTTMTWLENRGRIVARGGTSNGNGGDVIFHGRMPDGREPVPGNVDTNAHGTGTKGDFVGD